MGVMIALIFTVADGLVPVLRDLKAAVSPRELVVNDRRLSLAMTAVLGSGVILATAPVGGLSWGALWALPVGVAVGMFVGFVNPWPAYVSGRVYLALRHLLPWPLLDFLEDAHRRGVLRQAGAVYQFRHVELQHRLAARHKEPQPRWWQLSRRRQVAKDTRS